MNNNLLYSQMYFILLLITLQITSAFLSEKAFFVALMGNVSLIMSDGTS